MAQLAPPPPNTIRVNINVSNEEYNLVVPRPVGPVQFAVCVQVDWWYPPNLGHGHGHGHGHDYGQGYCHCQNKKEGNDESPLLL